MTKTPKHKKTKNKNTKTQKKNKKQKHTKTITQKDKKTKKLEQGGNMPPKFQCFIILTLQFSAYDTAV